MWDTEEFKRLLDENRFQLFFIPQVDLQTYEITGVEAKMLYIGNHDQRVEPRWLISSLENAEMAAELELMALRTVCGLQRERMDSGKFILPVTTNFSLRTAVIPFYIYDINLLLKEFDLSGDCVILSIKNSEGWTCTSGLNKSLPYLKKQGWKLCLPDLDMAMISLAFLREQVVDSIKINRLFLKDIETSGRKQIVLNSIMELTKQLEVETVYDGIETMSELEWLQKIGCTNGQGRLFGGIYTYEEIIALYERGKGFLLPGEKMGKDF